MPAYSFQQRFVPMVLDGTKRQTVRKRRKYAVKKGDPLALYFAQRTKYCRKLRQETCTEATTIVLARNQNDEVTILIFDRRLTDKEFTESAGKISFHHNVGVTALVGLERDQFAWLDGFRTEGSTSFNPEGCYALMTKWWVQTHELPFIGDLIKWVPDRL